MRGLIATRPSALRALWYAAHPGQTLDGEHICAVCSGPSGDRYRSTDIMADTFTRYDVFRRPDAEFVCDACAWYLDGSGKRTGEPHDPFQKMSFVIQDGRWFSVLREDVRAYIAQYPSGPPTPVYLILSRVKKKHLALLAQPWVASDTITVQFEEATIRVRWPDYQRIESLVDRLLMHGIGKMSILSGQLSPAALRTVADVGQVLTWMRELATWRPSPALEFVCWIARTPEREEIITREVVDVRDAGGRIPAGGAVTQTVLPLD